MLGLVRRYRLRASLLMRQGRLLHVTALGGPRHLYRGYVHYLYLWAKMCIVCMRRRLHVYLLVVHPTSRHGVCPGRLVILHSVVHALVVPLVIGRPVLDTIGHRVLRVVWRTTLKIYSEPGCTLMRQGNSRGLHSSSDLGLLLVNKPHMLKLVFCFHNVPLRFRKERRILRRRCYIKGRVFIQRTNVVRNSLFGWYELLTRPCVVLVLSWILRRCALSIVSCGIHPSYRPGGGGCRSEQDEALRSQFQALTSSYKRQQHSPI